MYDFDATIEQAKRIVDTNRAIAADVFPDGAVLTCGKCGTRQQATTAQTARYFSTGWPQHCGATMNASALTEGR